MIEKFQWDDNQKSGSYGAPERSNSFKRRINYKDPPKVVNFDVEPCFEFETDYREVYRTKVKMIMKHGIKALLKNKKNYSFKVTHSRGLVSGITSLCMSSLTRHKAFF